MDKKVIVYDFSQNFIAELLSLIDSEYISQGRDISRLAFVFEGGRPALFLKHELAKKMKKGFFPPKFFEINEFVEYIADKGAPAERVSDLEASYIIYKIAGKIAPGLLKGRDKFAKFLPWAKEVLNFIDKLDMEDIEVDDLKNVEFKARIGYDIPPAINEILGNIIRIRDEYQRELKSNNKRSKGMIYKDALRLSGTVSLDEFDRIFFANILSFQRTQRKIIKTIFDRGIATLIFQGSQEDWPVLKQISSDIGMDIVPDEKSDKEPSLKVYSAFDTHSQVSIVKELVKGIKDSAGTLVLLPDTDKVVPLLSELSDIGESINVSMGYPLKRSALVSLFKFIFEAQETKRKNDYYAKDYLKVMMHPFVKNINILGDRTATRIIAHSIEECILGLKDSDLSGSLFLRLNDVLNDEDVLACSLSDIKDAGLGVNENEIKGITGRLHTAFFTMWEDIDTLPDFALKAENLIDLMLSKNVLSHYPLDLNIAERILAITEELKRQVFKNEKFSPDEMFNIFMGMIEGSKTRFRGSPLSGIQVLGLWESRLLNFSRLIVMDMNESIFPKLKLYEPLIPSEIMLGLGILAPEKEEEIQRYHFTRLYRSADEVSLIYEETGKKERSRFLERVLWDREKSKGRIGVVDITRAEFAFNVLRPKSGIKKTGEIISYLGDIVYSASSINTYINCPLSFYYRYSLGLREDENELDEIDSAQIGTFVHSLLEDMYKRFEGKKPVIDSGFKKEFLDELEKRFKKEFRKKMRGDAVILMEIIRHRMKKFIENEKERAEQDVDKVLFLEQSFSGRIDVGSLTVRLKAIVDRIDAMTDGSALILDYKTGGSSIMPSDISKMEGEVLSREFIMKKIKSVQLPLYLYLAGNDKKISEKSSIVNAALYNLRTAEIHPFFTEKNISDREKIISYHMDAVRFILGEILDKETPFTPCDANPMICSYCPYGGMCK